MEHEVEGILRRYADVRGKKEEGRCDIWPLIVLKLGNVFEVKVLNPDVEIESGTDEVSGKRYYTLY